jgi:SagB-type dehydrogenase family enzyme
LTAEISKEALGYLLWATQGVTGVEQDQSGKITRRHRAAPSAGGRHPLETYLAVQRVEGLPQGLYLYLPNTHELLLVREDPTFSPRLRAACYNDAATNDAAVIFIWSATPVRTEWKYAYLAHRMIAMEAGHVCENLYLAAQSCHLGACGLLSYHQPEMDALLGLDGLEEFTLYLACVGRPAEAAR